MAGAIERNVPADALWAPEEGPHHPTHRAAVALGGGRVYTGMAEAAHIDPEMFQREYSTFKSHGYAMDPSQSAGGQYVGSADSFMKTEAVGSRKRRIEELREEGRKRKRQEADRIAAAEAKGAQEDGDDSSSDDEASPWADVKYGDGTVPTALEKGKLEDWQMDVREGLGLPRDKPAPAEGEEGDEDGSGDKGESDAVDGAAAAVGGAGGGSAAGGAGGAEADAGRRKRGLDDESGSGIGGGVPLEQCDSKWHGKPGTQRDYQGRSWIEPPRGQRPNTDHDYFIPKKCVHKWTGHTKAVSAIEFFPTHGHLLLSGSADTKVKVWDVYNHRRVKRTYMGHTAGVKDVGFASDGKRFVSCSYDKYSKVWDTETGKALGSFTTGQTPFCCKFHPRDSNVFVTGTKDRKIVAFDVRTGEVCQEYDHHLSAVNTVTFVEDGRRFVSTSDDKKILVWDWDTPVPIKYISDPAMHSVPAVTLHPSGDYFAGQSLDNTIVTYGVRAKYRQNRKKTFQGHVNAGYACQIGFSPNGRFIMSGDGEGKLWFWDWKSTKLFRKYKAHDAGPCIGAVWHPWETSKVATCGWDGMIKLWD